MKMFGCVPFHQTDNIHLANFLIKKSAYFFRQNCFETK